MAKLTLSHISKTYPPLPKREGGDNQAVAAVQDLCLEVNEREFVVLVGPSGCGKSTILRMIAGLEEITSGDLYMDGVRINELDPKDRDTAMVFQDYALYPHMSVYENIAFALKHRLSSRAEIDRKVRETAAMLGLSDCLERKPKALSGGQRQRTAIGRAIVRNPKIMLMDEPLSNLDAALRTRMHTELIRLRQQMDAAFIYVTHDQNEALTLADRVVVLKEGVTRQIGTPREVYEEPANHFTASFIGTPRMNFFRAEWRGGQLFLNGQPLPKDPDASRRLRAAAVPEGLIELGVRPDCLLPCDPDTPGCLKGRVELSEMNGSSCEARLSGFEDEVILLSREKDERGRLKTAYRPGDSLAFTFQPGALHFFDLTGGSRLC